MLRSCGLRPVIGVPKFTSSQSVVLSAAARSSHPTSRSVMACLKPLKEPQDRSIKADLHTLCLDVHMSCLHLRLSLTSTISRAPSTPTTSSPCGAQTRKLQASSATHSGPQAFAKLHGLDMAKPAFEPTKTHGNPSETRPFPHCLRALSLNSTTQFLFLKRCTSRKIIKRPKIRRAPGLRLSAPVHWLWLQIL